MRVLVIVDCYLPSTKSSAKLIHDLAVEMVAMGHDVTVVAPDPGAASRFDENMEDGVRIVRILSGEIKGSGRVLRAINEVLLSSVLWRRGRRFFMDHPCELIIFYSPTIFFGRLVKRLKDMWKCPAYLILRDIFPQWAVDAGVLRRGLAYRYFKRKERFQYDVADVIGVESPGNFAYFRTQGWEDEYQLEVLYNWTTLEEVGIPDGKYRTALGLEGKAVFFYGGNIGVAQDMDNIVRLADGFQDREEVHFLLVGEGSEVRRLKRDITRRELSNITIHPAVGQREYLSMLREFDAGLISLDKNLKSCNLPGKLLGYLYYSKPVLASVNPGNDLKKILEASEAGLVSINGNDDQLRKHAQKLAQDPDLRRCMGRNGRSLLERTFSVSRCATQILSHYC